MLSSEKDEGQQHLTRIAFYLECSIVSTLLLLLLLETIRNRTVFKEKIEIKKKSKKKKHLT